MAYDPVGAMGGLFAPAFIYGNQPSMEAVDAWNKKNLKLPPSNTPFTPPMSPGVEGPGPGPLSDFPGSYKNAIAAALLQQGGGLGDVVSGYPLDPNLDQNPHTDPFSPDVPPSPDQAPPGQPAAAPSPAPATPAPAPAPAPAPTAAPEAPISGPQAVQNAINDLAMSNSAVAANNPGLASGLSGVAGQQGVPGMAIGLGINDISTSPFGPPGISDPVSALNATSPQDLSALAPVDMSQAAVAANLGDIATAPGFGGFGPGNVAAADQSLSMAQDAVANGMQGNMGDPLGGNPDVGFGFGGFGYGGLGVDDAAAAAAAAAAQASNPGIGDEGDLGGLGDLGDLGDLGGAPGDDGGSPGDDGSGGGGGGED